jgi:hypothetical protein
MKQKIAVSFGFLLLTGSFVASTRTAHAFAAGDPVPAVLVSPALQSGDPVPPCPRTGCPSLPTRPKLI